MTVYVDDMYRYSIGEFGNMKMSHMVADTTEELLAMADKIGVQRKWIQYRGTYKEHFDIAMSKRELALRCGAIPITFHQCGLMDMRRRVEGKLGRPDEIDAWVADYRAARREEDPLW